MKKRLVALTLVAAMALGMTACGSKSEGKISTNDTSANGTSHTAVSAGVDWTGYDELVDSILCLVHHLCTLCKICFCTDRIY
jgi:peptide/nickel transport system substrate-binding protein/oligopeptide transport system substrate-binding protein